MSTALHSMPVSKIVPNPANVRDGLGDLTELTASVRAKGILQPITVTPRPGGSGMFMVVFGHRRFAAARRAGLQEIPVLLRAPAGPDTNLEDQIIENFHRADMTAAEKAQAFGRLLERGYSAASIAKRTGLSASTVSYYLTLRDLDDETLARIQDGTVSVGDAVEAVRAARHQERQAPGRKPPSRAGTRRFEPDHFSPHHPLARKAQHRCDLAGHTMRRKVGKVACGSCWEDVIRDDAKVAGRQLDAVLGGAA
jgi:ParB family chromosome partitioning protein